MTTAHATFQTPKGDLVVGPTTSAVVGTLTSSPEFQSSGLDPLCDIAEVRLDQMPLQSDWLVRCQSIESRGTPIILTVRHKSEGGNWDGPEQSRREIAERALEHLAAVDLELRSEIISPVAQRARELDKICIGSFHDFEKTPSLAELEDVVSRGQQVASIVKISTMARGEPDIQVLRELLAANWSVPLCVIGMGAFGTQTRVSFPTLGSCLTYGYLDKSAAPGQLPASELVRQLRSLDSAYNAEFERRRLIKAV